MMLGNGSAHSNAPPAAFFARWVDHRTWAAWSSDADSVRVDGAVREGARGHLTPRGGPRHRFQITTLDPPREYTDTSHLPGGRMVVRQSATATADGTDIEVSVTITGPRARLWGATTGRGFRTSVQGDLDRLVALVEAGS
jgi:uncharacterized protein YndB with AHSA1/START domain